LFGGGGGGGEGDGAVVEFGRFLTGFMVVMGIGEFFFIYIYLLFAGWVDGWMLIVCV
jgi:hypothetical protein